MTKPLAPTSTQPSVTPGAVLPPALEHDADLDALMNEFMAGQAQPRPASPPLSTTHNVQTQNPLDSTFDNILQKALEDSFKQVPSRPTSPVLGASNMSNIMDAQAAMISLMLKEANTFFSDCLEQAENLPTWVATRENEIGLDAIQAYFISSQMYENMLSSFSGYSKGMDPKILSLWSKNYPLCVKRFEDKKLTKYLEGNLMEMLSRGPVSSDASDLEQINPFDPELLNRCVTFFEDFLKITEDETAKTWLTEKLNKGFYPFFRANQLRATLQAFPQMINTLDKKLINKFLDLYGQTIKRVSEIGREDVLNEDDPQFWAVLPPGLIEKQKNDLKLVLQFYENLLSNLKSQLQNPSYVGAL